MRQLNLQRGVSLVELMVAVVIAAILMVAGLPAYADYIANSRLREGANVVVSAAQFARSEAIRRNRSTKLDLSGQQLVVSQGGTPLRTFELPAPLQASGLPATFDSTGRLSPFGADVQSQVSSSQRSCAGDLRCPTVHIEAGGAVSLCRSGACP